MPRALSFLVILMPMWKNGATFLTKQHLDSSFNHHHTQKKVKFRLYIYREFILGIGFWLTPVVFNNWPEIAVYGSKIWIGCSRKLNQQISMIFHEKFITKMLQ